MASWLSLLLFALLLASCTGASLLRSTRLVAVNKLQLRRDAPSFDGKQEGSLYACKSEGHCIDQTTHECSVPLQSGQCAGGTNIRCCKGDSIAIVIGESKGACRGTFGHCIDEGQYSCRIPTLTGKCQGGASIRCCQASSWLGKSSGSPQSPTLPQTPVLPAPAVAKSAAFAKFCPSVPNLSSITKLRYVDLNIAINTGYIALAKCFQAIVSPTATSELDFGRDFPVWYVFAPYASRMVGSAEKAIGLALASLPAPSAPSAPGLLGTVKGWLQSGYDTVADVPNFVKSMFNAMLAGSGAGALDALLSPSVVVSMVSSMTSILMSASGASVVDKMITIANTLRGGLEDGNRKIYTDVGGMGISYLNWRNSQPGPFSGNGVVTGFCASPAATSLGVTQAGVGAAYNYAIANLASRPSMFGATPAATGTDMMVAGIALYEDAGQETDASRKENLIRVANNYFAYQEQKFAVQPAFSPGSVMPGEVDRPSLFKVMSPTIALSFRFGIWKFHEYCAASGKDLLSQDWGKFNDRWPAILNAFDTAYPKKGSLWVMPSADPSVPF